MILCSRCVFSMPGCLPACLPACPHACLPAACYAVQAGKRPEGASSNINGIVDKAFEASSLKELLAAPPSALQGLAPWWVGVGSRGGGSVVWQREVLVEAHRSKVGVKGRTELAIWLMRSVGVPQHT